MENEPIPAVALARRGFYVAPCARGAKHPAFSGWQEAATRDGAQILAWWNGQHAGAPVAIVCDQFDDPETGETVHLVVLDLDRKDGKDGVRELDAITTHPIHGGRLPKTLTVRTPSGGRHVIFKTRRKLRNPAPLLHEVPLPKCVPAHGIDIRASGALVVGAGSKLPAGEYVIETDAPVAWAPAWLEDFVGDAEHRARARGAIATTPSGATLELDQLGAVRRAREYLERADPAIEGRGGDAATIAVANAALDFGVSEAVALDLLAEHWNPRCSPPWAIGGIDSVGGQQTLGDKVASAARSRQQPIGSAHPAVDFDEVEVANDNANAAPSPRQRVQPLELLADDVSEEYPDPLIEGLIDQGSAVLLIGHPKAGKSHAAYALAHAVATGRPLAGRHVEAGGVLYIQYEGHAGMRARRAALRIKHGSDGALAFWRASGNILHAEHQQLVVAQIHEAARRLARPISLVVVDTVSAAAPGLKQNEASEVSKTLEEFKGRVLTPDRALLLLHHQPKSGDDPAGSFVWRANVDAVLRVEKLAGGVRNLVAADMRDHAEGNELQFRLESVRVGTTRRGRAIESAVALFGAAGEFVPVDDGMSPALRSVQATVRKLLKDAPTVANGGLKLTRAEIVRAVSMGDSMGGALSRDAANKRVSDWWEFHGRKSGISETGRRNAKTLVFHPMWEVMGAS
jgi:KaiC/GvpD/RAD55 family RecA-like ATPase